MASNFTPLPAPESSAAEAPAAKPAETQAATQPADPYADLKEFIPAGVSAKDFVRETLSIRHRIDNTPGGLDRIVYNKALEIAPQLAEQLLRSPEGRGIAEKIVGVRQREAQGEELSPDEKRFLDMANRMEQAEKRAKDAEELAQGTNVAVIQQQVVANMNDEFAAARREQPEMEDLEPVIRKIISAEAIANPDLLDPGWVKRRALELHGELSVPVQKAGQRVATRGRATGSAGGGKAAPKDPTTLSREEAADWAASIMLGEA